MYTSAPSPSRSLPRPRLHLLGLLPSHTHQVSKAKALNQRPVEPVVISQCGLFIGGDDGGALHASAKRPITQKALLKQVFEDCLDAAKASSSGSSSSGSSGGGGGGGSSSKGTVGSEIGSPKAGARACRHSELLLHLRPAESTLRAKFSKRADAVIKAVESHAVQSGSDVITRDQFVEAGVAALQALRATSAGGSKQVSTPQRRLEEALEVDAKINNSGNVPAAVH
jgi:hypothetical protein